MLVQNSQLRAQAIQSLRHKWLNSALVILIIFLFGVAIVKVPYLNYASLLLLGLPLGWGVFNVFLDSYRGAEIRIEGILDGFKDYGRIFGTIFLVHIYTCLWTLLLVIPGIVKSYSYSMTSFILKDDPTIKYNEAIEKSMAMMDGNKMKLFLLHLTFLGWILLSCLTAGIGLFFVIPYIISAQAAFYEDVKKEQMEIH